MINKKIVSTKAVEVKSNGTISTKKPSTVTMSIDHRFAVEASLFYMAKQANETPENGLIGFELVAIYEDGKAQEPIEVAFNNVENGLDEIIKEGEK